MGREVVLKKALKDLRKAYDVILIDCPPALGLLTINGLVASDYALISSEAQYFALQGVNGAVELIEQVREYYNDDLELVGVLLNIADMRTTHSRDAYTQLQEVFGEKVFASVIRSSIAYAESAEKALSILEYRPDLGADYLALADEVLSRIGREHAHPYTDASAWGSGCSTATTPRRSHALWRSGSPSTRISSTPARRTRPRARSTRCRRRGRMSCSWTRSASRATTRS